MAAPFQVDWLKHAIKGLAPAAIELRMKWVDRLGESGWDNNPKTKGREYVQDLKNAKEPGTIGVLKELIAAREAEATK